MFAPAALSKRVSQIDFNKLTVRQMADAVRETSRFEKRHIVLAYVKPSIVTKDNVTWFLNEQQLETYRALFKAIDIDGSNTISTEELEVGLSEMGLDKAIVKPVIDKYKGQELDYATFVLIGFRIEIGLAVRKSARSKLDKSQETGSERHTRNENQSLSKTWRDRGWEFINNPSSSFCAYMFANLILFMIILSSASFIFESIPALKVQYATLFDVVDAIAVIIFTIEVIFRFLVYPNRSRFLLSFMNWVDIIAIVPYYISLFVSDDGGSANYLLAGRLFRIFRVLKVGRRIAWFRVFAGTFRHSIAPIGIFQVILGILLIYMSTLVYYAERGAWDASLQRFVVANDPRKESFDSIPATMWFTMSTFATVGFGDMYPLTWVGKLLAATSAIVGIILLAIPVAVISTEFRAQYLEYNSTQSSARLSSQKFKLTHEECQQAVANNPTLREMELFEREDMVFALTTYDAVRRSQKELFTMLSRRDHENRNWLFSDLSQIVDRHVGL